MIQPAGRFIKLLAGYAGVVTVEVEKVHVIPVGDEPGVVDHRTDEVQRLIQAVGENLNGLLLGRWIGVDLGGAAQPALDEGAQLVPMRLEIALLHEKDVGDHVRHDLRTGEHV